MAGASTSRELTLTGLAAELRSMGVDPAAIDYSRGLRASSLYIASQGRLCFAESRSPDGVAWPPFKRTPSRRRGGRSAKLLIDRGLLMASMSAKAAGVRGAVREITRTTLEQGSNLDYAGPQNDGSRDGSRPPREFVGITDRMGERIETLVADDVVRQMGF